MRAEAAPLREAATPSLQAAAPTSPLPVAVGAAAAPLLEAATPFLAPLLEAATPSARAEVALLLEAATPSLQAATPTSPLLVAVGAAAAPLLEAATPFLAPLLEAATPSARAEVALLLEAQGCYLSTAIFLLFSFCLETGLLLPSWM